MRNRAALLRLYYWVFRCDSKKKDRDHNPKWPSPATTPVGWVKRFFGFSFVILMVYLVAMRNVNKKKYLFSVLFLGFGRGKRGEWWPSFINILKKKFSI